MTAFKRLESSKGDPPAELWLIAAADEEYRLGLAVALRSAVERLPSPTRVHICILDAGLTPHTRLRLASVASDWSAVSSVEIREIPAGVLENLPLAAHFTRAAYGRLLLQDALACETA